MTFVAHMLQSMEGEDANTEFVDGETTGCVGLLMDLLDLAPGDAELLAYESLPDANDQYRMVGVLVRLRDGVEQWLHCSPRTAANCERDGAWLLCDKLGNKIGRRRRKNAAPARH